MTVFQDIEHLAEFIEKVVIGHARYNQFAVFLMNRIPVNAFRVQKAIPFVNDLPPYIGENFYANFNLVVVDDIEVHIGNNVMVAPNVTLSVTGHPVDPEYRRGGTQFSLPIVIGDDVWIGANSVILPGVTIGDNSVIGAGSVVTQDIPANSVAYGVPCRVIREINDYDKEYYRKGKKVNLDW